MGQKKFIEKKKNKTEQTKEKITREMALGKTSEEKLQLTIERKFIQLKRKRNLIYEFERTEYRQSQ